MDTPDWINKSFLTAVFQEGMDQAPNLLISEFTVTPAVPLGNNFFSQIYRVKVRYRRAESSSEQLTSLIIKSPVTGGFFKDMTERGNLFKKEIDVYELLLPEFYKRVSCHFGPKSFYSPRKSDLILNDLVFDGYKVCDKHQPLDFSYCKSVVATLAKFHAASVSFYHEDPTTIERIGKESLITETSVEGKILLENLMRSLARIAKEIYPHEVFGDYLLGKVENLWDSLVKIHNRKLKGLNVLNHGDLWINNILFKTDDFGGVIDVKFIDFQFPRYASPVLDILSFIWTSADNEVKEHRQRDLYDVYLQTLNSTLQDLGCEERFTVDELYEDLKTSSDIFFFILCQLLPGLMCDSKDAFHLEDVKSLEDDSGSQDQNKHFEKMLYGKRYWNLFPTIVGQFESWLHSI